MRASIRALSDGSSERAEYRAQMARAPNSKHRPASRSLTPPAASEPDLAIRLDQLREAIRSNCLSFPSNVPAFERHESPDLQWRFALLYFVRGWECKRIAAKYGILPRHVRRILRIWCVRAMAIGYVQPIPPSLEFHVTSASHGSCEIWIPHLEIQPA
jgi:Homeodomain-like domain